MSTTLQIILAIVGSGAFSSLITVISSKRLKKSQSKTLEAEAAKKWSEIYSDLINRLYSQVERSEDLLSQQEKELERLRKNNAELEASRENLIQEIHDLETELDKLRKQLVKLTNRLKKYEDS